MKKRTWRQWAIVWGFLCVLFTSMPMILLAETPSLAEEVSNQEVSEELVIYEGEEIIEIDEEMGEITGEIKGKEDVADEISDEEIEDIDEDEIEEKSKDDEIPNEMITVDDFDEVVWEQVSAKNWGRIRLNNTTAMIYGFGPDVFTTGDASLISPASSNDTVAIATVNAALEVGGSKVQHLYHRGTVFSSPGYFLATETLDLSSAPTNVRHFRSGTEAEHRMVRVVYNVTLLGRTFEYDNRIYPVDGRVVARSKITQLSGNSISNLTPTYTNDTELAGNDRVPIYSLGGSNGLYISNNQYRLNYWLDGWNQYGGRYRRANQVYGVPDAAFATVFSTGVEAQNLPSDSIVAQNVDTGFSFKKQPVGVFNVGDSVETEFQIDLSRNIPPVISQVVLNDVDVDTHEVTDEDVSIAGLWRDDDSLSVNIYYQVGDNLPKIFYEGKQTFQDTGSTHAFEGVIPKEEIVFSDNQPTTTITIFAIDNSGIESNRVPFTWTRKKSQVFVYYESVNGRQLLPQETIDGHVGLSYETQSKVIDSYELIDVIGEESGVFTEEVQEVTYVYQSLNVRPVDPLDPEVEVDLENKPELPEDQGPLSIDFISSFNFGAQAISAQAQTYYAQPQRLLNEDGTVNEEERPNYVQISDRRPEDSRNGWGLAVTQKEQFKGQDNQELLGARISLSNQQVITAQGGTPPGLQSVPCELIPGTKRTLLKAQGTEGTGTWIYRFGDAQTAGESVVLEVPKGANPERTTYSTTLVWELSAVPGN